MERHRSDREARRELEHENRGHRQYQDRPAARLERRQIELDVELQPILESYAELVVKVGVNLQAGQRLLIIGSLANGGTSLEAAPFVRHIAARAYQAGAELVETIWGDEALQLTRFKYAGPASFEQFSAWLPGALAAH